MTRYALGRLLATVPVLVIVTVATFAAIRVVPGDVTVTRLGEGATAEDVEKLREILGLDRPLPVQYLEWMGGLVTGDFGRSLTSDLPVGDQLWRRLPVTVELAAFSIALAALIGVPLGVFSAAKRGTATDHVVRVTAVLGQAVPGFWVAILLLTLLSTYFHWIPPFAYRALWEDPLQNLEQFVLPVFVLGYTLSAIIMRLTRSAMLEVLSADYVRTARAKGLTERIVIQRHALRNTLIPIVTVIGTQAGALIGGTIIIEQIFSLPGVGKLTLQAIFDRDYTQLQFNVLFIATVVVMVNLLVDLSYGYLDPRIRVAGGSS